MADRAAALDGPPGRIARLLPAAGPRRVLALATFVNTFGTGLFMTGSALFLTRSVGLPATQVGLALGLGALIGLLAGIPVGSLADQLGPRGTYLVTLSAEAVAMGAFTLVRSLWTLIPVICAVELAAASSQAARAPLIRGFGADDPVGYRAYLRGVTNLGIALGALAGGAAVQLDTRAGYLTLLIADAVTFLGCATIVARLPRLPVLAPPAGAGRWLALRDGPFAVLTVLNGAMAVQYAVGTFAVPLWIVGHTHAPRWMVGATMLINTLIVVLLQVRTSRHITSARTAARALRWMGLALLAGYALIAATEHLAAAAASSLLLIAIALCTLGELWYAAAGFEISFGLAVPHAQGQYTGVFNIGLGLGTAAAPAALSLLCLDWGPPGWVSLGMIMVLLALITGPAVHWAERSRRQPALAD